MQVAAATMLKIVGREPAPRSRLTPPRGVKTLLAMWSSGPPPSCADLQGISGRVVTWGRRAAVVLPNGRVEVVWWTPWEASDAG
jgi:hypothetical protein